MGTKIEYAIINPLGASQNSGGGARFRVDDWLRKCSSNGVEDRVGTSSMARMFDNYNVDSIKKTMERHEDTFKHQVRELHRLYSVQKMLMDDLKKELKQRKFINNSQLINWKQPSSFDHISSSRDDIVNYREGSGSCGGDGARMTRGFDLERPVEEVISTGVIALGEDHRDRSPNTLVKDEDKMNRDYAEEDSDIELTLSIGSGISKGKIKNSRKDVKELDSSASFKSGESDPSTPMSSSSGAAAFDQERKQTHWIFHGLKLK